MLVETVDLIDELLDNAKLAHTVDVDSEHNTITVEIPFYGTRLLPEDLIRSGKMLQDLQRKIEKGIIIVHRLDWDGLKFSVEL